jgi:SET domain-containing protein
LESGKKKGLRLYVAPSRIHKYGLFTKQKLAGEGNKWGNRIRKYDLVIEYTGEVIRNSLADQRETTYIEKGFGDCYMFRASKDRIIDATFSGSSARYLNHSCDSNCASIVMEDKILMYAKRDIIPNEELTYDYQFEVEA